MSSNLDFIELCNDFEKGIDNPEFSDLTITVKGGKTIHAHKVFLFAQSPVFKKIFKVGTPEYYTFKTLEIIDFEYKVVYEMLRFIYSVRVQNMDDICEDLYVLAKRYALDGLVKWCATSICKKMQVDNAFEYLKFAKLHGDEGLEQAVKNFIIDNEELMFRDPTFFNLDDEVKNELINLAKTRGLDRPATDEEIKGMIRAWMTAHGI